MESKPAWATLMASMPRAGRKLKIENLPDTNFKDRLLKIRELSLPIKTIYSELWFVVIRLVGDFLISFGNNHYFFLLW